jgi:hypothetical protein
MVMGLEGNVSARAETIEKPKAQIATKRRAAKATRGTQIRISFLPSQARLFRPSASAFVEEDEEKRHHSDAVETTMYRMAGAHIAARIRHARRTHRVRTRCVQSRTYS